MSPEVPEQRPTLETKIRTLSHVLLKAYNNGDIGKDDIEPLQFEIGSQLVLDGDFYD